MPPKRNGPEQVADFFAELDHPLKGVMLQLREIILAADGAITEQIKWKSPSFCHGGDDRVTFNIRNDKVLLIFHRGAKVKEKTGRGRLIEDPTGLLNWITEDRAMMEFGDIEKVAVNEDKLTQVVRLWIAAARSAP